MNDVICPKCEKKIFVIGNLVDGKPSTFEITCPLCKEGKVTLQLTKPFRIFFEGDLVIDSWQYDEYVKEVK